MTEIVKIYQADDDDIRNRELIVKTLEGAIEIRRRAKLTTDDMRLCGQRLSQKRNQKTKELGRGHWLLYFDSVYGDIIPIRTAQRWMKIYNDEYAMAHSTTNEQIEGSEDDNPQSMSEENRLRLGLLALDIFPKKTELITYGNVPAPKLTSYITVMARLDEWIIAFHKRSDHNPMPADQHDQLLRDFQSLRHKVIEFCNELEAVHT